jgi:hypothetical protein
MRVYLLAAVLLFSHCGEKKVDAPPANLIEREQFVKVLAAFALAESAANTNPLGVPVPKIDSVYAFDPLKDYNVRKTQYDSTLHFYTAHTGLYKKVYEDVLILLTELQAKGAKADSALKKQTAPHHAN